MAKLSYSKLGIKPSIEIKNISFNEQNIEVKQYLSIVDKLKIVENILNFSAEDKRFYNVGKIETYMAIEIIMNYTNIAFTDKQKEDPSKIYDSIITSGFYSVVIENIPEEEINFIKDLVDRTIKSVYSYSNSIFGILDAVSQDYSNINFDAEEIRSQLENTENMELLKSILTKLG